MSNENFKRAKTVELSIFNPEYTVRKQFADFIANLNLGQMNAILDYGAGNSPYQNYFKYQKYVRADVGYNVEMSSDLTIDPDNVALPVAANTFDFVLALDVLEHVKNFEDVLAELHRVLTPEGDLLVKIPFVYREHEVPYDYRRLTTYGLVQALETAGFRIEKMETLGNAWSSAYTAINERWANAPQEMTVLPKILNKVVNTFFLPILNLTLFKGKNPGIFGSVAVFAKKLAPP